MIALSAAIKDFARYVETSKNWAAITKQRYVYEARRFASHIGNKSVERLTPQDLLGWNEMLHSAGGRAVTIEQKHAAVRAFLRYLDDFDIAPNAAQLLKAMRRVGITAPQEAAREPFSLTEEQAQKMIEAAGRHPGIGKRNRAVIHFLWNTGVRRAGLIGLKLGDIDLEDKSATVTEKGNKTRVVFFTDACREDMTTWLDDRKSWPQHSDVNTFFINADGDPMGITAVRDIISDAARRAGMRKKVWPHIFRHTSITRLLDAGMKIQDVAAFHGHVSTNTTMKYFHPEKEKLQQAYAKAMEKKTEKIRQEPA